MRSSSWPIQLPAVARLVGAFRPTLARDDQVSEVLRRFVPALSARGIVQLSSFLDLALAAFLVTGAVATLGMVMPLYLISIGVFGFSVATAELTEISRSGLLDEAVGQPGQDRPSASPPADRPRGTDPDRRIADRRRWALRMVEPTGALRHPRRRRHHASPH